MTDQKQAPERIWFYNDDVAGWIGLSKPHLDQYGMEPVPYVRKDLHDAAIKRQASAAKTLRNSTLAEVQHLKDMDRSEYNAAKSLDSEREANARLTAEVETLTKQRDELAAENERLRNNTTRFPDLMASIVAAKDEPLNPRIERLIATMSKLPESMHQYQWEADEKQLFGEKYVRTVCGNNGQGRGVQAIASCPQHIDGLAEYIAAANPDTVAMLIAALNQALAASAAREIAMRDRAAQEADDWFYDPAAYDVTDTRLRDSIRALPLSPDSQQVLNETLADAWDEGHRNYLSGQNPYRKDATRNKEALR